MGRKIAILSLDGLEPYILDIAIDHIGSDLYARSDIDHQVYLSSDQELWYDTDTKGLKTIAQGDEP